MMNEWALVNRACRACGVSKAEPAFEQSQARRCRRTTDAVLRA